MADRKPMTAKYIGDEDMPNSKSTVLYGARRRIGESFEVPEECEGSARVNPFVQVLSDPNKPPEPGGSTGAKKASA